VAAHRTTHPRAAWLCLCGGVSVAGATDVADDAGEPSACAAWALAARLRGRVCPQKRRADPDGTVCLHAQSAVPGIDDLPTIRSEEQYLREHFAGFDEYAAKVPRLLPRLTPAQTTETAGEFSRELYLHHREYNASMGAIAIYAALAARLLFSGR
jgi:hypothetical protein